MADVYAPPPAPLAAGFVRVPATADARRRLGVASLFAVLTGITFAIYAVAGVWLIAKGNYLIGDAAVRVANARVILFSRDPHLAALGIAWMPLPVLSQLPFTAALEPFGVAWASGALASATFGAATAGVLLGIARRSGLSSKQSLLVVSLYALNPVVVFWMASGMSEASGLFFLALAGSFLLRWFDDRSSTALGGLGLALAFSGLTRYEAAGVTVVLIAVVVIAERRDRRRATAVILAAPSLFAYLIWFGSIRLLTGGFFTGLQALAAVPVAGKQKPWLPDDPTLFNSFLYSFDRVLRFAPLLLVLVPLALRVDGESRGKRLVALALGGGFAVFPGQVAYYVSKGESFGNTRYFLPLALLVPLLAFYVIANADRAQRQRLVALLAVGLVVGGALGTYSQLQRNYSATEGERFALRRLLWEWSYKPGDQPGGIDVNAWRAFAAQIDGAITGPGLVALDTNTSFPVLMFTSKPRRFSIPEDRDFEQFLQLTRPAFSYIVLTNASAGYGFDLKRLLESTEARYGKWEKVLDRPGRGTLYHLVPPSPGSGGAAPTGGTATDAGPATAD